MWNNLRVRAAKPVDYTKKPAVFENTPGWTELQARLSVVTDAAGLANPRHRTWAAAVTA